MEQLKLEATHCLPFVDLNPSTGKLVISGKSTPEDPEPFYNSILSWLDSYMLAPQSVTEVTFKFDSFNIASSKRILFILYKLNEMVEKDLNVTVNWCYGKNDDDMYEIGMDFAFMVSVPFKFNEYRTNDQPELVSV